MRFGCHGADGLSLEPNARRYDHLGFNMSLTMVQVNIHSKVLVLS